MRNLLNSFRYAMNGIIFCARYERNMRIHIIATLYLLYFSSFYDKTREELILLILTCVLVMSLEIINTSIEVIVDKVSPHYHTLAKIAKDAAAGAVFIASAAAVVIGILLFWDVGVFLEIKDFFLMRALNIIVLVISIIISFIFINSVKERKKRRIKNKGKNDE
ncbi:MAG: diacylglycerol kinase family protein [Oscillospiraceae bacterium]|nr:diacylglycerol kinase family protein [Oscillospiraceae bacterium]